MCVTNAQMHDPRNLKKHGKFTALFLSVSALSTEISGRLDNIPSLTSDGGWQADSHGTGRD